MKPISKQEIQSYLIKRKIFPQNAHFKSIDILEETDTSEGYVNHIFRVIDTNTNRSVVVKQVMPYMLSVAKTQGEIHPFGMDRMRTETRVLTFLNTLYNGVAPELYIIDQQNGIIVMEDLCHLDLMRFQIIEGFTYPVFGKQAGAFLGGLYFYTSDLYLNINQKQELIEYFKSSETKRLGDLLFKDNTLINADRPTEPETLETRQRISSNPKIKEILLTLEDHFINDNECLGHNDLHTSNILIDDNSFKIIDTEFSGYTSCFMDLGRLSSSFIINYISWLGLPDVDINERIRLQAYDLSMISDLFNSFYLILKKLWQIHHTSASLDELFRKIFLQTLQCATIGTVTRITSDFAMTCDIKRIKSRVDLALVQKRALEIAEYTLLNTSSFTTIEDFTEFLHCSASVNCQ